MWNWETGEKLSLAPLLIRAGMNIISFLFNFNALKLCILCYINQMYCVLICLGDRNDDGE